MTIRTAALAAVWLLVLVLAGGTGTPVGGQEPTAGGQVAQSADSATPRAQIERPVSPLDTPFLARARSFLGLLLLTVLAWALGSRGQVPWRVVLWGIGLQLLFATFILKTALGLAIFGALNDGVMALLGFTVEGARFVFGNLVYNNVPLGIGEPGNNPPAALPGQVAQVGGFIAFTVLPTIIFFSSLMAVLYHLGVMQVAVKACAWVMQRTMRTSGAETLSVAANIFVGQIEAPLLIRPFLPTMTRSELMAIMTAGFASVAGGVLAAYVGLLAPFFPDVAGHLMAASVMSAPATFVVAKLMIPEDTRPLTAGTLDIRVEKLDVNLIAAAARGAGEGLQVALNVGAMLIAFIALVMMLNGGIGWLGGLVGVDALTLQAMLGWVLAPVAWIMGVPWADAPVVGQLMGIKTVLNEFVAYLQLSSLLGSGAPLAERSVVIATYALAGFANFGSVAMQIGSIGEMAPDRRDDLARLGLRAMAGGAIATFMTATVAGMLT